MAGLEGLLDDLKSQTENPDTPPWMKIILKTNFVVCQQLQLANMQIQQNSDELKREHIRLNVARRECHEKLELSERLSSYSSCGDRSSTYQLVNSSSLKDIGKEESLDKEHKSFTCTDAWKPRSLTSVTSHDGWREQTMQSSLRGDWKPTRISTSSSSTAVKDECRDQTTGERSKLLTNDWKPRVTSVTLREGWKGQAVDDEHNKSIISEWQPTRLSTSSTSSTTEKDEYTCRDQTADEKNKLCSEDWKSRTTSTTLRDEWRKQPTDEEHKSAIDEWKPRNISSTSSTSSISSISSISTTAQYEYRDQTVDESNKLCTEEWKPRTTSTTLQEELREHALDKEHKSMAHEWKPRKLSSSTKEECGETMVEEKKSSTNEWEPKKLSATNEEWEIQIVGDEHNSVTEWNSKKLSTSTTTSDEGREQTSTEVQKSFTDKWESSTLSPTLKEECRRELMEVEYEPPTDECRPRRMSATEANEKWSEQVVDVEKRQRKISFADEWDGQTSDISDDVPK